ncbi:hypothetical protein LCGC14_0824900 [marine sediment metagenome]|uniref:Uncharacterized protein n=1 Tax=marine sediment metagenome TaxID=412755 RepID=A0A0F9PHP2_9ZZZZ
MKRLWAFILRHVYVRGALKVTGIGGGSVDYNPLAGTKSFEVLKLGGSFGIRW